MSYEFMICYDTLPEINTLDWTLEGFLCPFADKGPDMSHLKTQIGDYQFNEILNRWRFMDVGDSNSMLATSFAC